MPFKATKRCKREGWCSASDRLFSVPAWPVCGIALSCSVITPSRIFLGLSALMCFAFSPFLRKTSHISHFCACPLSMSLPFWFACHAVMRRSRALSSLYVRRFHQWTLRNVVPYVPVAEACKNEEASYFNVRRRQDWMNVDLTETGCEDRRGVGSSQDRVQWPCLMLLFNSHLHTPPVSFGLVSL